MKTLDDLGIADDTILVFSSDHGDMIGSHRMCLKQEPFEESISIPFVVRYPRMIPKGTVTDGLLSPVDMMPTLLGLAGAPIPSGVEGISLADAALGKRSYQQDALLIMKMTPGGGPWTMNAATPWRGVRTKTHTYASLEDGGPWVLYDNKSDPYQMKNLVNDPAHKDLQYRMEKTMRSLLKKAHDPFDSEKIVKTIAEQSKTRLPLDPEPPPRK
jgi:arylsulfatase A-like enzyme